jgi:hypothetical protein
VWNAIPCILLTSVLFYSLFYIAKRSAGTDYLTAQGHTSEEIKPMTKHKTSVAEKHYTCQLPIPICKTLAGFERDEKYIVPRTSIGLPGNLSIDTATKILFPDIDTWKAQIESDDGDKCTGARHFVDKVIPFLSEVILQDGIYWIKNHPNNNASRLLQVLLDGKTGVQDYSNWAAHKRNEIKTKVKNLEVRQNEEYELRQKLMSQLETAQGMMDSMKSHLDALTKQLSTRQNMVS